LPFSLPSFSAATPCSRSSRESHPRRFRQQFRPPRARTPTAPRPAQPRPHPRPPRGLPSPSGPHSCRAAPSSTPLAFSRACPSRAPQDLACPGRLVSTPVHLCCRRVVARPGHLTWLLRTCAAAPGAHFLPASIGPRFRTSRADQRQAPARLRVPRRSVPSVGSSVRRDPPA
jgi:hypothetical protein